ncbi:PREDICTED: transmembrane 4 L6 family member 18, partial [Pterocles gutturalis]|uniref:transmembrane 4 L6 family member 18 n=1 Tax=Pterocles gutturalis TaxID=240206 RepID=UPI0005291A83
MALETCGSCLSCLLIPLALWSIVVNILLYFPNGKASHAASYQLPNYVWYFEGICFSGVMILLLAVALIALECSVFYRCCQSESCNKTYRSFISIVLALLGAAFSGYSCIIFTVGLIQGPFCNSSGGWDYIFKDTAGGYLTDYSAWSRCTEPANIVEWNIILLSVLIALSGLQLIICSLKVAAELKRTLCGTYSVFVQVHERRMKLFFLNCLLVLCCCRAGAVNREYYIGITETVWNYAPGNTDIVSGQLFAEEEHSVLVQRHSQVPPSTAEELDHLLQDKKGPVQSESD